MYMYMVTTKNRLLKNHLMINVTLLHNVVMTLLSYEPINTQVSQQRICDISNSIQPQL